MKKKPNNKRMDFLPNKLNKYSIRKFTVGTTSILIGSLMFLGNSADAAETTTTTTDTTATPSTDSPTTEAPTTEAATTEAATTEAPTTEAPTTEAVNTPVQAQNLEFNADNTELTGIATSGQVVELHLADGTIEKTVVDTDGTFTFRSLTVASEEVVSVITVDGDVKSEAVKVTANKIVEATTEAPTTETATTEAPTTEAATTETATTETATTEAVTTETATTETATTEAPTTEAAPVVTPDVATAPETTEATTSVADTTAALTTATTDAEKQQVLADTVVSNTGITQEEASAYVANLNLDYANLTNEELTALLLQAIANSQAANELPVLAPTTDSSLTNAESLALSANAVETTGTSPMTLSTLALGDVSTINALAATSPIESELNAGAIYTKGTMDQLYSYRGHAWIYKDGNMGDQSNPAPTMKVYLQWVDGQGTVSPVFYTTTNADGSYSFDFLNPDWKAGDDLANKGYQVKDVDGNVITKWQIAGDGGFAVKTWVENPDPSVYNVIKEGDKVTGFHTRTNRTNESWNFTAGVNVIETSEVILQEIPNSDPNLLETPTPAYTTTGSYGIVSGTVWYDGGDIAGSPNHVYYNTGRDLPATGTQVAASYVNDEVTRQFDAWKTANPGYTLDQFKAAQKQIIADYEALNGAGSHIAESVVATVDQNGNFLIPFKGLYGYNAYTKGANTVTAEEYGKVVADADLNNTDPRLWDFTVNPFLKDRHINTDYIYLTTLVENYNVWSNSFQNNMFEPIGDSDANTGFNSSVNNQIALLANTPMHDVLVDTAAIGDTVNTRTDGLLPNTEYQVQWFKDGKPFGGPVTVTSGADGTVGSQPITVPSDITGPTTFTSAVFWKGESTGNLTTALAADSFVADVAKAPDAPVISPVDNNDTTLNVTGTPGSTVTVTDNNNNIVGTVVIPTDGTPGVITLATPLTEGTTLTSTATNSNGTSPVSNTVTVVDVIAAITAPPATVGTAIEPIVISNNDVGTPNDTTITVNGLPSGLTYSNGQITGTPSTPGTYTVTVIGTDENGTTTQEQFDILVEAVVLDADTNQPNYKDAVVEWGQSVTIPAPLNVDDTTPPIGTQYSPSGTLPSWVTVNADGTISVSPDSTVSPGPVTVQVLVTYPDNSTEIIDVVIDVLQTPHVISEQFGPDIYSTIDPNIVGAAEPGSTITIQFYDGETFTGIADENGNFSISVPFEVRDKYKITGGLNYVISVDEDGNETKHIFNVHDTIPPQIGTLNPISPTDTELTGSSAEPDTLVIITDKDANILYTAVVDANGNYTVPLNTPLTEGTEVFAVFVDNSENIANGSYNTADGTLTLDPNNLVSQIVSGADPNVDASNATVTEGQAITPIEVTITDESNTTEVVTGLPSGLTYDDANNQIIGTPDIITDWNDDAATGTYEETRDFPVTIEVTDEAGNVTEETITITVQRDTDGDGNPDVTDTDDDNDGIPDTEDNNPKVADTTAPTVDASDATVTEGQAITPIPVTITDDNDTTEEVTGLPSGLTYDDANNQIIGTPDIITDWNDDA
ncbi:hypothetical protein BFS35_012355, partial [Macrococcoides goetzii]